MMSTFTLENFVKAHSKVKSGADFPKYVQELKQLGMSHYDFFVSDGHTEYHSINGQTVLAPAKYPTKPLGQAGNKSALHHTIKIHQQGQTDFPTFIAQAIDAGVQYWRTDVANLQCVYIDVSGNTLLIEPIPDASGY